ncbi:MAG: DUF3619 family protein [Nitrosomonadales bacterium]|nr:DUF3619 family protein [Nitrosomonadales bacterium]
MTRKLKTHEIGRLLNRSAERLDQNTLDDLQSARRSALKYQQKPRQVPVLAWLTQHGLTGHRSLSGHKTLGFGIAMLFAAVLLGSISYCQHATERDHVELDIAILTDDLPVDMFVD